MAKHEFPRKALDIASKAGFITKELWKDYIYGRVGNTKAEKRRYHWAWNNLLERGYLIQHPNKHLSNVLVFNKNNRDAQRYIGGIASRSPYESNIRHDEMLLRGLLKIESAELLRHWTLESELKSNERDEFRLTSQGRSIKYPDAILYPKPSNNDRKVAIELELTLKNRTRYKQIIGAYGFLSELPAVIFVYATPAIEKAIKETVNGDHLAASSGRFGFMSLAEWQRNPIDGEIDLMNSKATLKTLFYE